MEICEQHDKPIAYPSNYNYQECPACTIEEKLDAAKELVSVQEQQIDDLNEQINSLEKELEEARQ